MTACPQAKFMLDTKQRKRQGWLKIYSVSYLFDIPLEALISFPASFCKPLEYVSSSSALVPEKVAAKLCQKSLLYLLKCSLNLKMRGTYMCWKTTMSSLKKFSPFFEYCFTFWYSWLYWKTKSNSQQNDTSGLKGPGAPAFKGMQSHLCDICTSKLNYASLQFILKPNTGLMILESNTHRAGVDKFPHLETAAVCGLWTWNFDHSSA